MTKPRLTMTCADCAVTSEVPSGEGVLLCQFHASTSALLKAAKTLRDALAAGDPQYSMNPTEGNALNALDAVINEIERGKIA